MVWENEKEKDSAYLVWRERESQLISILTTKNVDISVNVNDFHLTEKFYLDIFLLILIEKANQALKKILFLNLFGVFLVYSHIGVLEWKLVKNCIFEP